MDRNIIIFDLGSVLIDGDFDKALLQDPRIPNEYIEDLKNAWVIKDNPKFTETCTRDEYIQAVMKNTPLEIKYYIPVLAEINTTYLDILPHTYSLLNTLREEGYSLYYLSNWSKWHVEELKRNGKMDFLKLFDGGLFSYETGYMKPDQRIYTTFLNKYDIDPNDAIFFDDNQDNINAANKLGIQAILFTEETGGDILKDFILNESYMEESNKASDNMPKKCTKCGSTNIGTFIQGEPIYKCKDCGEYLGTVPFKESIDIFPSGYFDQYKEYGEASLSTKERNSLPDEYFGIPEIRKYPLHDKKHVEAAIKMFNRVDKKYESELADNLLDAMEKYHISTDVVGDKNRLKKYIKEETIYEGLIWNDNTPKDIKQLKKDIREDLKKPENINSIIDKVKDMSQNKDFKSDEKKIAYKVLKRNNVNIHGYTIKSSTYNSVQISNTHTLIGTYKNYIITIQFIGVAGNISLSSISINYDKSKSDIPKNVAFNFVSMLSPNITKISSTRRSIRIFALSNSIDSAYPRIDHKYSKKYNVKKIAGMYIKLSTLKSIKEDSLIAAAIPRQDYDHDSVYIINYMKNNTFNEDIAICKDKMSDIFIFDETKPKHISLSDFKEMTSNISVYKYEGYCNFKNIIESSNCALDFYRNMVNDKSVNLNNLNSDYRFTKVSSYIDELKSIEECIINSAPKISVINEIYCPIIPLVNLNEEYSSVQFFRDIDGVFAQNVDTLFRSASYNKIDDIPNTTINILKNI